MYAFGHSAGVLQRKPYFCIRESGRILVVCAEDLISAPALCAGIRLFSCVQEVLCKHSVRDCSLYINLDNLD